MHSDPADDPFPETGRGPSNGSGGPGFSDRVWPVLLIVIMVVVVVVATGGALVGLYRAAFDQQREMLANSVYNQARLIEVLVQPASPGSPPMPSEAGLDLSLQQVREALYGHPHPTVAELVIARREGDRIKFLSLQRQKEGAPPLTIPITGTLGEPMRRALAGGTDTMVGLDYRGEAVLAAFQPVPRLGIGMVVKVDLAVIQAPFKKAALVSVGIALLVILLAATLFRLLSNSVVRRIRSTTRALESNQDILTYAQEIAHIGHWVWDVKRGRITWSDETFRIFGLPPDGPVPDFEGVMGYVHPDDRADWRESVLRAIDPAVKIPYDHLYRIVRPNGECRTVQAKGETYFDAKSGKASRMMGAIQDITERKAAEQKLEASERDLAAAQAMAHLGHWEWDINTGEITGSAELFRIWNVSETAENLDFELFFGRIHPDDRDFVAEELAAATDPKIRKNYAIEHRIVTPEGKIRTIFERAESIWEPSTGKALKMVGTSQDVTEMRRFEEALVDSEKMRTVAGLAAGMAHEINNPLASILQNLQNLRRRLKPGFAPNEVAAGGAGIDLAALGHYIEQRGISRFLDDIQASGERAAAIVSGMLRFSRTPANGATSSDMEALITNAVSLAATEFDLKKKYDFRSIAIDLDVAPDIPVVPCSTSEIEQVLLKLLENAAQAFHEQGRVPGEQAITIHAFTAGDKVQIEISDNGPGMDEETRRRVFEPFFTTKAEGEGSGLGLSVAYFIVVNAHGGDIRVESTLGQGTRFVISLPLGKPVANLVATEVER